MSEQIHSTTLRRLSAPFLLIAMGVGGLVCLSRASAADDEGAHLEVHEWSVWMAEPQLKNMNAGASYPTAMPGLVDSERSRKRDEKPKPAPVSLMTIYGKPPEVVDVDLKVPAGRPISQWPRSEGKANRLRWLDLTLSKELEKPELIAYIPETHWFHQARALGGLYIQLKKGGRAERFFAYDLELNRTLTVRVDGGPDQYKIANLGKQPVNDILLLIPGEKGTRIGWVDSVGAATPAPAGENKPAGAQGGQPQAATAAAQPAAVNLVNAGGGGIVMAVPAGGGNVVMANPGGGANQNPQGGAQAAQPAVKETIEEITLSEPLAADSDEFKQRTDGELRRRLATTGLTEGEINLMLSLYSKYFFATDEMQMIFRVSTPELDEITPLAIEPETAKIKRTALVITRKVDPRLREDVQKLVTELADANYAKREDAEKRLNTLGNLAVASLKEAMKSKDLEVVMRAERILLNQKEQLGPEQPAQ